MNKEELDAFLAFIPGLSVDKMVKLFVKTRAAKAAASKIFDAADAEFKLILETCENHMLSAADKAGVTGFTTPFGTTYTAETSKISIADDTAFFDFVRATGDLDFFERRVSSTHVANYLKLKEAEAEQLGTDEARAAVIPPPGLNIFRERVMRVRKATEK
jgi:hypothetical protein